MSLLWYDQPAAYSTATMLQRWTQNFGGNAPSVATATIPRAGTAVIQAQTSSNTSGLIKTLGGEGSLAPTSLKAIIGFRYYIPTLGAMRVPVAVMSGVTMQACLNFNADGTASVYRGNPNSGGVVLGTSTAFVAATSWIHGVLVVTIGTGTAGSFEVFLNNVSVLSGSGVNTAASGAAAWGGIAVIPQTTAFATGPMITDVYVCDGTDGTTLSPAQRAAFNTSLGDKKIDWYPAVAGNGANADSTPSTGTDRGANVDDAAPNGTTDYNTLPNVNNIDTYGIADMGTNQSIEALMPITSCTKDDAGSRKIAHTFRIGGTNYVSPNQFEVPGSGTFMYLSDLYTKNPATGAQFTPTEFNTAGFESGVKVTA